MIKRRLRELRNYVPFQKQQEGKEEVACPAFCGDLAVLDAQFRVLAARGLFLKAETTLSLPPTERETVLRALTEQDRVAVCASDGVAVFSGELLSAGLFLVLLPHGKRGAVARALCYLAEGGGLIVSDAVRANACGRPDPQLCMVLETELLRPALLLSADGDGIRLRERCYALSRYAGCAIRYSEDTDAPLLLSRPTCRLLHAFLLCTLLELRRACVDDVLIELFARYGVPLLSITSGVLPKQLRGSLFGFLSHPSFRACAAEHTKDGRICLSLCLPRPEQKAPLRAEPFVV